MTIIAAADGSALGNPGPSGWAWYIDDSRWRCGGWKRGTNNQGELTAVLDLLRQTAHSDEPLHVLCDSQYVINSITKWMAGWKRKGWKKADGKPVLNVEVMKALDQAMQGRNVTFEWVKGHAGHELNEKADVLANGASKAHASGTSPKAGPGFPGATAVGAGDDPSAPPPVGSGTHAEAPQPVSDGPEPDLFSMDDDKPESDVRPVAAVDLVTAFEQTLLTDVVGSNRDQLTAMLDPAWIHVCARGEIWRLEDRLAAAENASGTTADGQQSIEVIETRELGPDVILLVWREITGTGSARATILRSSVWHHTDGRWKQAFQQGTREN